MDIGGIVLNKILSNPSESLESWSKLKSVYFSGEYLSIYSIIVKFYDKNHYLPTFNEALISVRNGVSKSKLIALEKLEVPEDIPLSLAVEALINQFAQNETLNKLDTLVDGITSLDSEEIKLELADILLYLEEKTHSSDGIVTMSDISVQEEHEVLNDLVSLGFNNTFDAEIRAATTELIMIGGHVGSGKSVLSTNIVVDQFLANNCSIYFSIEMRAREPFNRIMSMLSGVSAKSIRLGTLTEQDFDNLAKARASFFTNGEEALDFYNRTKDFAAFEKILTEKHTLKPDNQIVLVDNQNISLMDIDMTLQKYKAQFGDALKVVVLDYVNQIQIEDIYSWKSQIMLSKGLKDLARKYEVCMVTPYQIDKEGTARFSKGILDAADMAMKMTAGKDYIQLESIKTRGTPKFTIASGMDWDTLRVNPVEYIIEEENEEAKEDMTHTNNDKSNEDLPF